MENTKNRGLGEKAAGLKAVPFFTQLTERELELVRSLSTEKHYPKNAVVLTEGEMGDSLFMIRSGKVKVFIGDQEGREMILKILGIGDFFGEMSMIDKQPRSASVTTLEPSTFQVLTHAMKGLGYGKDYRYAHDEDEGYAAGENYLPEGMERPNWYRPTDRGLEAKIREKLEHLRQKDDQAKKLK